MLEDDFLGHGARSGWTRSRGAFDTCPPTTILMIHITGRLPGERHRQALPSEGSLPRHTRTWMPLEEEPLMSITSRALVSPFNRISCW
jgi:hypothetical protein